MSPLLFVVHSRNGQLSPALYHDTRLPREHDRVVYALRVDGRKDFELPRDVEPGRILDVCWDMYNAGLMPPSEMTR